MRDEGSGRRTYTAAHWGVYEVEHGAPGADPILHVLSGDPDPSPIGLDQLDPQVQRLRVARPRAVRRGDWDIALDRVAAELTRVRALHGNTAIFGGSYGWASAGCFRHAQSQVHRFLNQFGGYVRSVDSYSLGAGRALMPPPQLTRGGEVAKRELQTQSI